MIEARPLYFALGANQHPSGADWDAVSGIFAFASDWNIALWEPLQRASTGPGPYAVLRGHANTVNAVEFYSSHLLVSGSADGHLRLWQRFSDEAKTFHESGVLDGGSSITSISTLESCNLVLSGSADSRVKLWKVDLAQDPKAVLVQTIKIQFLPLALAPAELVSRDKGLPNGSLGGLRDSEIVLGVAGTSNSVEVWVCRSKSTPELQAKLSGHEGWVRSLAFIRETDQPDSGLLLASASQDKYIRLWRIKQESNASAKHGGLLADMVSTKNHRLKTAGGQYKLTFDALLQGHDDWIYSVRWQRRRDGLQLLSASADNSLAIWEVDESTGFWVCKTRLGEISSQKGSSTATGSTGGFWNGMWSPDGDSVVSLAKTGSWRLWNCPRTSTRWTQRRATSGHTKSITDIAWAKNGTYLLSTSLDQTTRLHAALDIDGRHSWHEFARPQIHGYDLNCIDTIGCSEFVSGADEKSLRVFIEPQAMATLLERLCGIPQPSDEALPGAANIPMLSLSNKAVQGLEKGEQTTSNGVSECDAPDPASAMSSKTPDLNHPPFEDHLARHTLWPEKEKLYGHGFEISAVAASYDGTVIATACKASVEAHAVIRIYDTKDWREIAPPLTAHSLTVNCLRFSDDDKYLLSVGRDRRWHLFERDEPGPWFHRLPIEKHKEHSRMVLSASWAPTEAGRIFATAGRDKAVMLWQLHTTGPTATVSCIHTLPFTSFPTAVATFPRVVKAGLLMAVGCEDSEVFVYHLRNPLDMSDLQTHRLDNTLRPSRAVTSLAWRPGADGRDRGKEGIDDGEKQLAVASEDGSLRIVSVTTSS